MIFRPFYRYETGCAAYVFGCGGQGICCVVDPHEADVDGYIEFAANKAMRIAYVFETHIHADHRSGGRALAAKTGARYAMHRAANVAFPFEALEDDQVIELGNTIVRVLHTPGHTPESIALVVSDLRRGPEPWFVCTGDTLFVGSVGRPDLPGRERDNAAELHRSLHEKLLPLPGSLEVYPAHFSGSPCGAGLSGKPMTTIAFEKRWNPLLGLASEAFVDELGTAALQNPEGMDEVLRFNQGALGVSLRAGVRLGLGANLGQFTLLVVVNAFVGAMVGLERTILPAIAEQEFHLAARAAVLSFIVAFGISKALTNYLAGRLSDAIGRKRVLLVGWAVAIPVPFLLMWAPSWSWILFANVLLGISQGLTWSTTVIMKIDLAGPARRGFAMGLNEFAGYGAVALSALATGYVASAHGLRPQPFYLGVAYVVLGLALSLIVRDTHAHARKEASDHHGGDNTITQREIFVRTSFTDPNLSSISQAGLVNNLNDGMAWGLFPLLYGAAAMSLEQVAWLAAIYPAVWGIGQLFTGALSDRIGRKWLIAGGMWVQALGIAIIAASSSFAAFALGAVLLGAGTAMVYPTLLAAIGDVAHASWRASVVGVYRLWRDLGYAIGAVLAGLVADLFGVAAAIGVVAALTAISGLVVAVRMSETLRVR